MQSVGAEAPGPSQGILSTEGLVEAMKVAMREAWGSHLDSPRGGKRHRRGRSRRSSKRSRSSSSEEERYSSRSRTPKHSRRSRPKHKKRARSPSSDEDSESTLSSRLARKGPVDRAKDLFWGDQDLPSQSESEQEEGLSGEEEVDQKGPKMDRLCPVKLYHRIMAKAASAIDLETPLVPVPPNTQSARAKAFSRRTPKTHTVPFPEALDDIFEVEWASINKHHRNPYIDKLYTFPPEVMKKLQIPRVDAPVVAVSNATTLPTEGEGGPKDVCDKRTEGALKRTFDNASQSFRASVASSILSRAIMVWTEELVSSDKTLSKKAKASLKKMAVAAAAAADCASDSSQLAARGMASSVSGRRHIWLRQWQGDQASSSRIINLPFRGEKLFGEDLEPLLVEDSEKRRVLPSKKQAPKKTQPFRGFTSSFRARSTFQAKPKWSKGKSPYRYKKGGTAPAHAAGKPKQDQQSA